MKISTLQKIDRCMGVPLCFVFTALRKLLGRGHKPEVKPIRRILFVKLAEQGSTVLAYPALRRAVEMVGPENVYFVCFENNRFIIDALRLIPEQNVVPIAFSTPGVLARSALAAIFHLRDLELDAAIDMEFFSRGSAVLTLLSGASNRVGFHSFFGAGPYRGDLMTHRLLYNPYLHTSQIFQLQVESLQLDPRQLPTIEIQAPLREEELPRFSAAVEEVDAVRKMVLNETNCPELPPLFLLNPNASDLLPLRRWEPDRYVALAKLLLQRYPSAFVCFTGGRSEVEAIDRLVEAVGFERCISLAGKTTLRQLLILYSLSRVLVTNDSGPAHFAALTSIQVITLFGPETPRLFDARTPRNVSIWAGTACSPCVNAYNNRQTRCTNNICMQQISVQQVFEEACCAYQRSLLPANLH